MKRMILSTSALLAALVGCGDSGGGDAGPTGGDTGMTATGDGGGSTGDGGGSTGTDGGGSTGGDGGGSTGGDGGGSTGTDAGGTGGSPTGIINISQTSFEAAGMQFYSGTASAIFARANGSSGGSATTCTTATHGACEVSVCVFGDAGMPDAGPPVDAGSSAAPNAGAISITGGAQPITLTPDATTGAYSVFTTTSAIWSAAGTALAVSAPGVSGSVGAITASVNSPAALAVTAPTSPGAGQPLAIARATDLAITWTGGVAGTPASAAFSASATGTFVSGTCSVGSEAGTLTIPAAALGLVPAGAMGSLLVSATSSTTVDAGDWSVTVNATSPATNGSFQAAFN